MRIAAVITLVIAGAVFITPAYAQGRGGGHAGGPPAVHGNPHADTPKTGTPTPPPSGSGTPRVNPIAQKISANPQLESRLATLLPAGMTLDQASAGFRNQGQFIAALHVSHNLNIPFTDLKSTILGTSAAGSTKPMSLGQAIHKLRPNVDADGEAKRGTSEADSDASLKSSSSSTRK